MLMRATAVASLGIVRLAGSGDRMARLVGGSASAGSMTLQEGARHARHRLCRAVAVDARALPSSGPLLLGKALEARGIDSRALELLVVIEKLLLDYLSLLREVSIM